MPAWTTPQDVADQVGVTASSIRAWLRRRGHRPVGGRWRIDPRLEAEIVAHYAARRTEPQRCSVEGCERPRAVRAGWCRMHWKRWQRTGSLERHEPGANQKAKTHCPHGHEYTSQNTYVFADGRRRCATCRRKAARRAARRVA